MSQKRAKNTNNESSTVVEGEVLDDLAGLRPDPTPVGGIGLGKAGIYLLIIIIIIFAGWLYLPKAKQGLESLNKSLFEADNMAEPIAQQMQSVGLGDLEVLRAELRMLEERILELESIEIQEPQLDTAIYVSLNNIEERLSALEAVPAQSVPDSQAVEAVNNLRQEVAQFAQRLSEQENVTLAQQGQDQAPKPQLNSEVEYFITLVRLSRAVSTGRSYGGELMSIELLYANDADIKTQLGILSPWSEKGVPTDNDIVEGLKTAMPLVLGAEAETVGLSWFEGVWQSIKRLVTVRKSGEVQGEDIGAVMARAEVRIKKGDYEDALVLLRGTTLVEQQAMAQLLEMLDARVTAQAAINELLSQAISGNEVDRAS